MAHLGHRTTSIAICFLFFFSVATISAAQLVGGAIQGTCAGCARRRQRCGGRRLGGRLQATIKMGFKQARKLKVVQP